MTPIEYAEENNITFVELVTQKEIQFAKFKDGQSVFYRRVQNDDVYGTPLQEIGVKNDLVYGIPSGTTAKKYITTEGIQGPLRNYSSS